MEEEKLLEALRRVSALREVSPLTFEAILEVIRHARAEVQSMVFQGGQTGVEARANTAYAADNALRDVEAIIMNPDPIIRGMARDLADPEARENMRRVKKRFRPWVEDVRRSVGHTKILRNLTS